MERNRKGKKTNAFNAVDCAHQTSTLQFYVRGKSIIVITTLLLRQTLSSTSNICAFASTVAQRNAMLITFFFHLKIEKKKKNRHFQLQQWSLTVAAAPQQLVHSFFFLFFLPTTKTLQADTATIEVKDQNNIVWGVGMNKKKRSCQKKIKKKKVSNANSADLSLSTLNHMTSSGKPTSYACKRAHLISFRRCNTRQTHSACHQSVIPRLTFPLPNVRALSRASYNLVALARLRHHSS